MKPIYAILIPLLLAGCGESDSVDSGGQGSTTPAYVRAEAGNALLAETVTPVRIGESGANFAACNARGTTRARAAQGPVPVHAAPFEQADEVDRLPEGAEFYICTRSHDQRWFGIVYGEGGRASAACGVSHPVTRRRDYEGPCSSGWAPSALVRLVSGAAPEAAPEPSPAETVND